MSSKKPPAVCLICLKKFKETLGSSDQPYRYKHRLLHCSVKEPDNVDFEMAGGEEEVPTTKPSTGVSLYTKFLQFASRHLNLNGSTAPFLETFKDSEDGRSGSDSAVFCDNCKDLISHVCDLYAELEIVRLHLAYKLSQLGENLTKLKRIVSKKNPKGLVKSLADQLDIKEATALETFRKELKQKCIQSGKCDFPRPSIPRGLFPEEWKYPYSATRTALMNLIVVFLLWSPSIYMKKEQAANEDQSVDRKQLGRRSGSLRSRALKRSVFGTTLNGDEVIKTEPFNTEMECEEDEEMGTDYFATFESNDNEADIDWCEAESPTGSKASDADFNPHGKDVRDSKIDVRKKRKMTKKKIEGDKVESVQRRRQKINSQLTHRKKPRQTTTRKKRAVSTGITHTCNTCQQIFDSCDLLLQHLMTTHETEETKPYPCWFCPKEFTFLQTLKCHRFNKWHRDRNMFICEDSNCNEEFLEMEQYEEHLKGHITDGAGTTKITDTTVTNQLTDNANDTPTVETSTPGVNDLDVSKQLSELNPVEVLSNKSFGDPTPSTVPSISEDSPEKYSKKTILILHCSKCNWCFLDPDLLKLHEMVHIKRNDSGFVKCPKCPILRRTVKALEFHYDSTHGARTNVHFYECADCAMKFATKRYLTNHKNCVHKQDLSLICDECGFRTKNKERLQLHIKRHDRSNMIRCAEKGCGRKFLSSKELAAHVTRIHKTQKKHSCPHGCGAVFVSREFVNLHVLSVHSNQTFICDICGKGFPRVYAMRIHKKNLHNPNGRTNYICSECGMAFTSEQGLSYHVGSVHTPDSEKRYGCPHCPKRYHRGTLLKMHVKTCVKINGGVTGMANTSTDNTMGGIQSSGAVDEKMVADFIPENTPAQATSSSDTIYNL